jgi:excisionase family DNA binding protein
VTDERLAYPPMEAAEVLGVSWDTFHRYIAPEVAWVRIGSKKLVSRAELERWLAEKAEKTLSDE